MQTQRLRRTPLALLGLGLAMALLCSCGSPRPAPSTDNRTRVGLFGDSLAVQAAPYFNALLEAGGKAKVSDFAYGGTAACDWLRRMAQYARAEHPRAVAIEFVGNTFTSCMKGCPPGSAAAVRRYCSNVSSAIQDLIRVGAHVWLIGTPITYAEWINHDPNWDALNHAFAALAAKQPSHVTYIDAGEAVQGPHQSFVWMLPCLFFEPCNGPVIAAVRMNTVRSPDGVHFCPDQSAKPLGQVTSCDVYSSGAYRFAAAMAGPIIRRFQLEASRPTTTKGPPQAAPSV